MTIPRAVLEAGRTERERRRPFFDDLRKDFESKGPLDDWQKRFFNLAENDHDCPANTFRRCVRNGEET